MFFKRSPLSGLETAHRALAEGRYEAAFALLESAARRQRGRPAEAELKLYLAAIYALYGQDGLDGGLLSLREAAEAEPEIAQHPLYRALYWEFAAYRGDNAGDVRRGALAAVRSGDKIAVFHAASALVAIGAHRRAVKVLEALDPGGLPDYLVWRTRSLLGLALEQKGDLVRAADCYRQSVSLAQGREQQGERLSLAACLLESGHAEAALEALNEVDAPLLSGDSEAATYLYLMGRVQLLLGNPNEALAHLRDADLLERAADERSFDLALILAQTYSALGQSERGFEAYHDALELAGDAERALVSHEYAFALFENDRLLEARELLLQVMQDPDYAYRAEVCADLAEIEARFGNTQEADELARRALDLGAVSSACLCLGHLAYDYCRYDEALDWFEQALSASKEGEPDWLVAQEMLADCLVQQGYREPERLIGHAEAALRHLPPAEEWAFTLQGYVDEARARLGGHAKLLN